MFQNALERESSKIRHPEEQHYCRKRHQDDRRVSRKISAGQMSELEISCTKTISNTFI